MAEEIRAPLAGKIVQINISVGDQVQDEDEVLVMEAMKMETPVFAPCDGTVKEINIKEGDAVEEDQLLSVIE
ncbi:MAG TPA: acetyl-CoA carboxylase biotin carboxyl carrier protein subunit [Desulfohalobiaceae bacterium]|nr:acetyl-CoA carboxylase biotin carboxyl carrier protein subunit [Desulfohalobiaceae bacterium]